MRIISLPPLPKCHFGGLKTADTAHHQPMASLLISLLIYVWKVYHFGSSSKSTGGGICLSEAGNAWVHCLGYFPELFWTSRHWELSLFLIPTLEWDKSCPGIAGLWHGWLYYRYRTLVERIPNFRWRQLYWYKSLLNWRSCWDVRITFAGNMPFLLK